MLIYLKKMFGLSHKITDSSLYLIHDMMEEMLQNLEDELKIIPEEKVEEIKQIKFKVDYLNQELEGFKISIEHQRDHLFQFSVEELFNMYGQYDKFIGIQFHKFSDSAKKFGRNISGVLNYGKKERKRLEKLIKSDNIPRTNGIVKINVSSNKELTQEQIQELIQIGFKSGDIYEILKSDTPKTNVHAKQGEKEIPNTINIDIDLSSVDLCKLALYNFKMRIEAGGVLINVEWNKYYGYFLYYYPELIKNKSLWGFFYESDGCIKEGVRFYELYAKSINSSLTQSELTEFSIILKNRQFERIEMLKIELKKTGIKSIEKFKEEHPDIYEEINNTAITFEDEVLFYRKSQTPVYWDFKSYLHIYLRHCEGLQPSGHFKIKTPFAYKQKDIRRILKIAIEENSDKIHTRLLHGKEFQTYGEKAFYYNGNYYSMRVEKNGRVDSFFPYE